MLEVLNILKSLRNTSSTNEKIFILKQNKDNEDLKEILKYAYDRITFTYGIRSWNMKSFECDETTDIPMIKVLDKLSNREVTGHSALRLAKQLYNTLITPEGKDLFCKIIDRDLKIGVSEKTLNKIWKGIIPKPYYCRCGVFSKSHKIKFPALIQLKCDGTYREAYIHDKIVTFKTRSGEEYKNPVMSEIMKNLPDGYYTGEFTIGRADEPDMNRAEANGLINSDNPPYDKIHFTIWDYLTDEEYTLKEKTPYTKRFSNLIDNLHDTDERISVVPWKIVDDNSEALKVVSEWMLKGLEGGVLKSTDMKFKNGTSNEQLKIKLKVDADLRCKELILGNEGTKYEDLIKVIYFESDDGKIKGQCSGMTDDMIHEVTKNPENYLGKILAVEFNDLSKAQGNDYYALSHPRFLEWRNDKTESDTLERVIELRDMAKNL